MRILVPESAGEAVMQPSWTADGRLRFISDRSGWWNLYEADAESGVIRPLAPVEADIGKAPWLLGSRAYAELPNGAIVAVLTRNACDTLAVLERDASDAPTCWRELASPYVGIDHIEAWGDLVVFLGSTATTRIAVATLDPITGVCRELHRAPGVDIDPRYVSHAVPFICCGTDDQPVHAWFYPPTNPDFEGPSHARPPVLVRAHGGPTAHRDPRLGEFCQFWTSRGVAVLDVNYSGSTGYGTAYRKRLNGRWGDLDILDVVTAACACAERGAR
ncbi:MAG: prolyl oligopeptidase family serine peptidase [Gammaproteobacteria bacterium]